MDFDLTWLLWGLPLAFALGWAASRLDLRQWRMESRQAPKAYFRGLNHLLNEQQDQAIDAFIEAVQNDPDTSELHFALGNLFRRRGDYDRAVRVHQHLLSRADLSQADRERAQHALAMDYLKAGLLDRAEDALTRLEGTRFAGQARLARLAIYERSRDWAHAAEVAQLLEQSGEASFAPRRAHYRCEQARERMQQGDVAGAQALLQDTLNTLPESSRARLLLGQIQLAQQQPAQAFDTLSALFDPPSPALPLAASALAEAALASGRQAQALALLQPLQASQPCIDLLDALQRLAPSEQQLLAHLERSPSLLATQRWLATQPQTTALPGSVERALEQACRPLARYRCAACGFETRDYFWHCPGCQAWDSFPPRRIEEL